MNPINFNQYLRKIELRKEKIDSFSRYPYCLPAVKNLSTLEFHPKVTYIVGENGTGKSTILEAIAIAYGFNPEGGSKNFNFSTNNTHSELWERLKLVKGVKKPEDGFFLRAESFYNVATNIDEIDAVRSYGGISLHSQSHGESFLSLIMNRFKGNGLYILDEPEAALSPYRQMTLISRIHDLVKNNSQFIIATHSPIVMAYPDSILYELTDDFKAVNYQDTEHYKIMKSFVGNPKKIMDILIAE
ncbi:AAA family ATPase [Clostridium magnum]|uniref:Chromosome partition protein Smc n=1 Tax=Clostridium magnum DSM 2767 TaxID=1121326 RepID=A0A161YJF7_9CLOT|nr:AAA family ATPase [Clostridium magnum]KZL90572.1 chromosome partition protein Smc [Clostridium magnum DSM 2767]SHI05295.1 Predicted ATPase [Clostridium magnum DSM 2767]